VLVGFGFSSSSLHELRNNKEAVKKSPTIIVDWVLKLIIVL
jgi:hypothetical protein